MTVQRWWHRWQGICPDGALISLMPGVSPNGPDQIDTTQVVSIPTIGCPADDCETVMGYVGSWDHDPTEAELDAVTPPGYRSTDYRACHIGIHGGGCFYDQVPCRGACEYPRADVPPVR